VKFENYPNRNSISQPNSFFSFIYYSKYQNSFCAAVILLKFQINHSFMFSKASQYAIKSIIYIWTQSLYDRKVGAKEIGAEIAAPEAFTAKILQILSKAKLIGSLKGPNGGFYADDTHGKFTLKDVVKAMDGDTLFSGCAVGLPKCSEKNPCPLHFEIVRCRKEVEVMLTSKSLKTLALEVIKGETNLSKITKEKIPI
jgi:Rrf2 family transcriptional regulator, iron-sulfur cluster assembly transcription factor